jgi:S1-C subfamily serine protease
MKKFLILLPKILEDIKTNYSGTHSDWQKDVNELKVKFPELISGSENIGFALESNTLKDVVNKIIFPELNRTLI